MADGDYIKDIEVNDLRNRYLLTKGSTQKTVNNPFESPLICPKEQPHTMTCYHSTYIHLLCISGED